MHKNPYEDIKIIGCKVVTKCRSFEAATEHDAENIAEMLKDVYAQGRTSAQVEMRFAIGLETSEDIFWARE